MRFYTRQHVHYCGIDLHARSLYVCILDQEGKTLVHRKLTCDREQLLKTLAPYREDLAVAVECLFCWYWVADLCAEHGILLVIDAVICGFGRLGTWFGIERYGVAPDLVTFAKGVTSGYLPLGGVLVSPEVAAPWWTTPGERTLRHGPTYSGHPTCCAAGLATLDVYDRENLIPRGQELEGVLEAALAPLREHPYVAEVRAGTGLLAAVELTPDVLSSVRDAPNALLRGAREAGVLVRGLGKGVAVSPPLTITEEEIRLLGEGIRAGLDLLPVEPPVPSAPGA